MRRGDDRERRSRRVKSLFASSEAARRTGVQEAYQEAYRRRTRGEANPTLVSSIDYGMCFIQHPQLTATTLDVRRTIWSESALFCNTEHSQRQSHPRLVVHGVTSALYATVKSV